MAPVWAPFGPVALGADAWLEATDGTGLLDRCFYRVETLPPLDLAADLDATAIRDSTAVFATSGAQADGRIGERETDGGEIYSLGRRGAVDFTVTAPRGGIYQLEIHGGQHRSFVSEKNFPLRVFIDGEDYGRRWLFTDGGESRGVMSLVTPWLTSGDHQVRVWFDNPASNTSLAITAVNLVELDGADADGDGLADWASARLAANNTIDVAPSSSVVSPVCIEGTTPFFSKLGILADGAPVTPGHGVGTRWFANVPLAPNAPTGIEIGFEDGGLKATRLIEWVPHNLLDGGGDLTVRQGDSILFSALPPGATGSFTISSGGAEETSSEPVVRSFDTAGAHTVTGTHTGGASATITVIGGGFPDLPPATFAKNKRDWSCPDLPPSAIIEHDTRALVEEAGTPSGGGRSFQVRGEHFEDLWMVARIFPGGPSSITPTLMPTTPDPKRHRNGVRKCRKPHRR